MTHEQAHRAAGCTVVDSCGCRTVLRWQVLKIINDVFDNADTTLEARTGLLQRLRENIDRPEQALMAHLQDREDAGRHS
ncbi:hypothetical protein ACFVTE_18560 [Arthrobacter sp. NPDC058097]|uniref:hypothetical protein n=1 Tax=Arthrobacter sp. NPDC058097 TaxID=3346340 RepID=UPI0036DDAE2A